jgi:hypothetical protein
MLKLFFLIYTHLLVSANLVVDGDFAILGNGCMRPFCQRSEEDVSASGSPWTGSSLPNTIEFDGVLDIFVLDKLYEGKQVKNRPSSDWGIDLNGNTRFRLRQQIALISARQYDVSFKMIRSSNPRCPPEIVDRTGFVEIQSERLPIRAIHDYTWETYSTSFKANSNSMVFSIESENQGPCGIILSDVVIEIVPDTLPLPEPVLVPTVRNQVIQQSTAVEGNVHAANSEELVNSEEPLVESQVESHVRSLTGEEPAGGSVESIIPINPSVSATTANPLADGGSNLEIASKSTLQYTPETQSREDKTWIGQKARSVSSANQEPSSKSNTNVIPIVGACAALFVVIVILVCVFLRRRGNKKPSNPFKTRIIGHDIRPTETTDAVRVSRSTRTTDTRDSRPQSSTETVPTARTTSMKEIPITVRTGVTSMASSGEGFFRLIGMYGKSTKRSDSMQFSVVTSEA